MNPILELKNTGLYHSKRCFIITETCGNPVSYRSTVRPMTLNPHAPIFKPKNYSRLFAKNHPESPIEIDASTSQDVADPIVPASCPKTSSDSHSPTV